MGKPSSSWPSRLRTDIVGDADARSATPPCLSSRPSGGSPKHRLGDHDATARGDSSGGADGLYRPTGATARSGVTRRRHRCRDPPSWKQKRAGRGVVGRTALRARWCGNRCTAGIGDNLDPANFTSAQTGHIDGKPMTPTGCRRFLNRVAPPDPRHTPEMLVELSVVEQRYQAVLAAIRDGVSIVEVRARLPGTYGR